MEKVIKNELINNYRTLSYKEKCLFKKMAIENTGWSGSTFQYKMRNGNLNKMEKNTCENLITTIKTSN
jgi:hypothetical protein